MSTGPASGTVLAIGIAIPLLLVAATWYLAITSILMVGQYYIERHYSKGASRTLTAGQLQALAKAQRRDEGGAV